jgi:hypothetical protein
MPYFTLRKSMAVAEPVEATIKKVKRLPNLYNDMVKK